MKKFLKVLVVCFLFTTHLLPFIKFLPSQLVPDVMEAELDAALKDIQAQAQVAQCCVQDVLLAIDKTGSM